MLPTLNPSIALPVCVAILSIILTVATPGCGVQAVPDLGFFSDLGEVTPPPSDAGTDPVDQSPDETVEPGDRDADDTPPAGDGFDPDPAPEDDVPENAYCDAVADWDDTWMSLEEQVLDLVNQRRVAGADCGETGIFDPVGPLTMNPALRCAARNHSMDMGTRDYFAHDTPEGLGPGDRIDQAGYAGLMWAENIAWGYSTSEAVVAGWMSSPGHCANIMRAELTETGIGYYEGQLWTQTFGRP